ncbi:hypothetical protein BBJ29_006224 [Phytophthora kernoviae]|uniref:Polymer-forming cytoskeletal protein n=1 Tax=Phytophthora kernoviae TaxID=325452 RepID=A0A3F2RGK8_9STRA|nr:hypothetical protein BBJ29_006224 [Phytophthora kernoviae]RLN56442.1 hypothetical protein BBP00_00008010 [Phytophthora kernoviae]
MDDSAVPRNPPPKPKRSNVPTAPAEYPDDTYSDQDYNMSPIRRGRNHMNRQAESPPLTPTYGPRQAKVPIVDAEPETTIGAAVKMKGTRGALIGNVDNMKEVYITGGRIVGNVNVEKLVLRDKAQVFGNITAKTVKIEPDCIIIGKMNVNPQAPERINDKGEVVKDDASNSTPASLPK